MSAKFLELDDLVGNAFIDILGHEGNPNLGFHRVMEYGSAICKAYKRITNDEDYIIIKGFHRDGLNDFKREWIRDRGVFDINRTDKGDIFVVREGLEPEEVIPYLRKEIRSALPLEMLEAVISHEAFSALGIEIEES